MQADYVSHTFRFGFRARTSRGEMRDKVSWFVRLWDDGNARIAGLGECGPLPGLSPDAIPGFEDVLAEIVKEINSQPVHDLASLLDLVPPGFPSIVFGLETAFRDLENGGKRLIFDNDFVNGTPIPINGLIWMGDAAFMTEQIDRKVAQGFRCIKLKVGGLDFEKECNILEYIRKRYSDNDLILRLDANGAFTPHDALSRLKVLSEFNIHSIEQPIKAGLPDMVGICANSRVPVALDEELIGVADRKAKEALLKKLRPAYIILKPTLHGGMRGCAEWISLAEDLNIGWWITSALESNIGLNAICQFTAQYPVTTFQGLGTGMIYENNIASPLVVSEGMIGYATNGEWGSM